MKHSLSKKALAIIICVSIVLILAIGAVIALSIINKNNEEQGNLIKSIYIESWPEKLQYYVGEEANYDGLVIGLLKNNGSSETLAYTDSTKKDFSFNGLDTSKPAEERTVTVKYKDFSCNFYISVKEVPKPTPVLSAISLVEMPKTEYKVGEWLDTDDGMILKEYTDGSTERTILINGYVSGWDEARQGGPGTYTLTVTYKENGIMKRTTYDITITE